MRLVCKCKTLMDGPFFANGHSEPSTLVGLEFASLPGFLIVVTANTFYQCPACGERAAFDPRWKEHMAERPSRQCPSCGDWIFDGMPCGRARCGEVPR